MLTDTQAMNQMQYIRTVRTYINTYNTINGGEQCNTENKHNNNNCWFGHVRKR